MSGGIQHEHITAVRWRKPADGKTGENTGAQRSGWIDDRSAAARVKDRQGHEAGNLLALDHALMCRDLSTDRDRTAAAPRLKGRVAERRASELSVGPARCG